MWTEGINQNVACYSHVSLRFHPLLTGTASAQYVHETSVLYLFSVLSDGYPMVYPHLPTDLYTGDFAYLRALAIETFAQRRKVMLQLVVVLQHFVDFVAGVHRCRVVAPSDLVSDRWIRTLCLFT